MLKKHTYILLLLSCLLLTLQGTAGMVTTKAAQRLYESTNHLGNVLTTVSDKKQIALVQGSEVQQPGVATHTDYAPFGSPLAGRTDESTHYRYALNG